MVAEKGVKALEELWNTLSKENKLILKDHVMVCNESALAYDNQGQDDEIDKLETIKTLFLELSVDVKSEDVVEIRKVIEGEVSSEYDKIIYNLKKLKKLKNEQQSQ